MRFIFVILFCLTCFFAKAIDANSVHFRSASIDVLSQKYVLKWSIPNINDTAAIKNILILNLKTDAQQNSKLDTVDIVSNQTVQYTDNTNSCCVPQAYALRLAPKNNFDFPATSDLFRTMQFSTPTLDSCANTINLQWSAYQKLDKFAYQPVAAFSSTISYQIYGYIGGSTFKPDSVVWLASSDNAESFALPITQEKKYYHLYIAAVYNNGSDTSYSNRMSLFVQLKQRPQYISIDTVLVGDQTTTLHFKIDPSTEYKRFWAESSRDAVNGFTSFAEFSNKLQNTINNNISGQEVIFYRVSAINSCSRPTASSPVASSLAVKIASNGTANNLTWNSVSYDGNAAQYNIYRTSPMEFATFLGSTSNTEFSDNLSLLPDSAITKKMCYRLEAITSNTSAQIINYVNSAETCSSITPQVYMPNAIQLNSNAVNSATGKSRNLFEPVSPFKLSYTMYIYARNGKQLYSGSTPWNGRVNNTGNFVGEGSYIYYIKIIFVNGDKREMNGTVTVVY